MTARISCFVSVCSRKGPEIITEPKEIVILRKEKERYDGGAGRGASSLSVSSSVSASDLGQQFSMQSVGRRGSVLLV